MFKVYITKFRHEKLMASIKCKLSLQQQIFQTITAGFELSFSLYRITSGLLCPDVSHARSYVDSAEGCSD